MAQLSVSAATTVEVPRERAWELVSDARRYDEWFVGTDTVVRADHPLAEGSTYEERNTLAGPLKTGTRWTVTEYEPLERQVHRGVGVPGVRHLDLTVEARDAGPGRTEVTLTLSAVSALGPLGAAAFPVLRRKLEREIRRTAAQFARLSAA